MLEYLEVILFKCSISILLHIAQWAKSGFFVQECIGCIYLVKILAQCAMLQCMIRYNKPPWVALTTTASLTITIAWCHQIFFVNNTKIFVTSSVLKLQKWFLHQNGVESNQNVQCTVGDDVQPGQMAISGQKPSWAHLLVAHAPPHTAKKLVHVRFGFLVGFYPFFWCKNHFSSFKTEEVTNIFLLLTKNIWWHQAT